VILPPKDEVFYASAIVVKSEDSTSGTTFALDVEIAGDWVATENIPDRVIAEIRLAALNQDEGVIFGCILLRSGVPIKFLVNRVTQIKDE
jgi:hypothetical protein